jgi:transposase InsO family protein
MCRDCQSCARSKTTSAVHSTIQPIEMPARRFSHVHTDLVGPLPASSSGHTHLFTVVDRSTRWPEAIPLAGTTTADCVEAFLSGWVSRFGVPAVVTSDRGVQFTSSVWSGLCQKLGINHKLTTAYHPQANGLVERFHRQLEALRERLETGDWYSQLPWVMMGLRAAPKEDCSLSSAELVYGEPLTLPREFLEGAERPPPDFTQQLRQQMNAFQPPATRPQPQQPASAVLSSPDAGPVRVYQERAGSLLSLASLCRALQGGGERPEVLPARCRRPERGCVSGQTQASPRQLTPAASTAAQERPASSSGLLNNGGSWRLRTSSSSGGRGAFR